MIQILKYWKLILIVIVSIALNSCKTQKTTIKEVPIQYKEKIVERLISVKINGDSLKLRALFECDSLNQVVLKKTSEQKSKGIESQFVFNDGQLDYSAKAKIDTIYLPSKEITIEKEVPIRVEIPIEVNKLTKLQDFQIIGFRILASLITLFIAYKIFWAKIKLIIGIK